MPDSKIFLFGLVKPIEDWTIFDEKEFDIDGMGEENAILVRIDVPDPYIIYQINLEIKGDYLEVAFTSFNHADHGFESEAFDNTFETLEYSMADPEIFDKVIKKIKEVFIPIIQKCREKHKDMIELCDDSLSEMGEK